MSLLQVRWRRLARLLEFVGQALKVDRIRSGRDIGQAGRLPGSVLPDAVNAGTRQMG